LNAVSLRLKNEAETLRRNAEATYRQITKYKESAVSLVEQNLEDINNAYAQGQVDLGEVFRVQEQHLNIQTAQLELLHELEQILIEWRAATGNNLPNPSTGELSNETL
jgi:outer membrane protein TolC